MKISLSDQSGYPELTTDKQQQQQQQQQQQLKSVTNVLSNSRHTKQQHLDKSFKRNTSLFYNTENACLLVRETISLCSDCVIQTLALHELSWRLFFPDRFTFLEP